MKKKFNSGQALVEFVIILPISIFMLFSMIDLGRILYYKNKLESQLEDVVLLYLSDTNRNIKEDLQKIDLDLELEINKDSSFLEFQLTKTIDIITPGLNWFFHSPYSIEAKRVVANEP